MLDNVARSHIKLAVTPTPGEQSKIFAAGYKANLYGTIAGAGLYGMLGLAVGLAAGAVMFPFIGAIAFAGVPIVAGYGVIKGSTTFGDINSHAAQLSKQTEINEHRRALLDRLERTQSGAEADEILHILNTDDEEKAPESLFHWKTAIIGAVLGAIVLGSIALIGPGHLPFLGELAFSYGTGTVGSFSALAGAVLGAAGGTMIGLDRYYISKWIGGAEDMMHDNEHYKELARERSEEITQLQYLSQFKDMQSFVATSAPQSPANNGKNRAEFMQQAEADISPVSSVNNIENSGRLAPEMLAKAPPV
jgi:hypothetical protein